jgi:ABC-type nitrate/sulfonate/bicarbonate transport system substrate-binding protein
MIMNRQRFFTTSAALALGSAANPVAAQTTTPIIVAPLSGPDNASVYYAQQQGWFRQAGLDVTIQPQTSGAVAMAALIGGSAQIANSNVLSLCLAHAKGVPVAIVAPGSTYDGSVSENIQLVAAPGSTVRRAKDLNGKNVAVPGLSDLFTVSIKGIVDQDGGDSSSVHFIEMPPPSVASALQAGKIDAAGVYDPFLSAALAIGAKPIAKPYDSIGPKFLVDCDFAYRPWAEQHPQAVFDFASAYNRASGYVNTHYRELYPMVSQFSHIPVDVLAHMQYAEIATTVDPGMIQPVINAAAKYHVIPRAFPATELIFVPTRRRGR